MFDTATLLDKYTWSFPTATQAVAVGKGSDSSAPVPAAFRMIAQVSTRNNHLGAEDTILSTFNRASNTLDLRMSADLVGSQVLSLQAIWDM